MIEIIIIGKGIPVANPPW